MRGITPPQYQETETTRRLRRENKELTLKNEELIRENLELKEKMEKVAEDLQLYS